MRQSSFYEATRRSRIDVKAISTAQKAYTYNYLHLLPKVRDARIVDLGCSEGISLSWLLQNGYNNIVGIDSDNTAINHAKNQLGRKLDDDQVICTDALSYLMGCEDTSVDMVVMFNVIEHIPKDVISTMVDEIRRVLKPGGGFLVQTGNWENPLNLGLFARDFTHQVMYTKNSLFQLMVMSGFQAKNIETGAMRYKTTLKNCVLQLISPLMGLVLRMIALSMRIQIRETAPIIYCFSRK